MLRFEVQILDSDPPWGSYTLGVNPRRLFEKKRDKSCSQASMGQKQEVNIWLLDFTSTRRHVTSGLCFNIGEMFQWVSTWKCWGCRRLMGQNQLGSLELRRRVKSIWLLFEWLPPTKKWVCDGQSSITLLSAPSADWNNHRTTTRYTLASRKVGQDDLLMFKPIIRTWREKRWFMRLKVTQNWSEARYPCWGFCLNQLFGTGLGRRPALQVQSQKEPAEPVVI